MLTQRAVGTTPVLGVIDRAISFSLVPRGRHTCTVCMGTACHVRGAPKLVEKLERDFGIRADRGSFDLCQDCR